MKILFDTSVLIPALIQVHPRHELCHPYMRAAKRGEVQAYLSTHSLAEVYSVVTRLPVKPQPTSKQVQALIDDLLGYMIPVSLEVADYVSAINQMVDLNLQGGGIFDAIIAQAAHKANVNRLLTLNPDDFTRLSPSIALLVEIPQAEQ